jgi:hypothetical protein
MRPSMSLAPASGFLTTYYGGWTCCSIEDNIVEARALVAGWAKA